MLEHRKQRLAEFVAWTVQHVKGDEKGEAQIFLDHLFQAFGHQGLKEAGATLEMRIKKPDAKGTAFADLVWKPVVLIEMKKRGQDLSKHYRQAFDYWVRLVPGRPRYVVLCNFDEFWVYDFETQMDSPVDRLKLEDLPQRYGALAFLFPTPEKPVFGNDHEAVTRDAADRLATCFNKLVTRGVDRRLAQRFTLQILVAMFSEDIGLLEQYLVAQLAGRLQVARGQLRSARWAVCRDEHAWPNRGRTIQGRGLFRRRPVRHTRTGRTVRRRTQSAQTGRQVGLVQGATGNFRDAVRAFGRPG